uniref:WGS project CAEQ00000000 data, annotated contig 965 n=1 Tax=Trypanosoma congolense (strain IL3000) TaxID=1068625 RepID=F9WJY0_TRYCI|nr:unnamed protein product [Trypanosoma congolense IL3000]
MANSKPKKQSSTASKASKGALSGATAAATRAANAEARREELLKWLEANDPLYDRSGAPPITISELFDAKLEHKTFVKPEVGEQPYDWSKFRGVLESRMASSPRWFMQIREEDLLIEDSFDGVTVDCIVIAEAAQPTLAPAHYIVKQHLPYSDLEDNAPERILPIEGQHMYWRRVVRDDGGDINAFLLQKRTVAAVPQTVFGFGAAQPTPSAAPPSTAPGKDFNFGFATTPAEGNKSAVAVGTPVNFGFGTAASAGGGSALNTAAPAGGFNFGFGTAPAASGGVSSSNSVGSFGFGTSINNSVPGSAAAVGFSSAPRNVGKADESSEFEQKVSPLKPSEVLFALWTTKRLTEMMKALKSGSRVVREDFVPNSTAQPIKLVVQNDMKDNIKGVVRHLVLNRLFAKQCPEVKAVDKWINDCPVYHGQLAEAMQKFRENYLQEVAEASADFQKQYDEYREAMETELERIIAARKKIIDGELETIGNIMQLLKEKKLAEKQTFRLLKYYAANDVMRFRPFAKVSGISEMGESADVCDPPAPVIVNPFLALQPAS